MSFNNYSVLFTGIGEFDTDGFIQDLLFDYVSDQTTYTDGYAITSPVDPGEGAVTKVGSGAVSLFTQNASIDGYLNLLSSDDMTILLEVEYQDLEDCQLFIYTAIEPNGAYTPQIVESADASKFPSTWTYYSDAEIRGLASKFGFTSGSNYLTMISSSIESLVNNMAEVPIDSRYYPRVYAEKVKRFNLTSISIGETLQTGSVRYGTSSLAQFYSSVSEESY